jgi:cytochrome c553
VLFLAGAAGAEDSKPAAVSQKELQAKTAYCKTCHGLSAQGFRGASYTMPRLAGQQPEYIQAQLQAFIEHRRVHPIMSNVAKALSPAMVSALSTYFKNLDPQPIEGGSRDLAPEGQKIFAEGIAEAEVPPCSACHGDDAKGAGEFPRLAGQPDDYVIGQLKNWSKQRGQDPAKPDNSAVMAPIAEKLTPHQVAAIAAYVSSLK